jgi:hypothetical protein
MKAEFDEDAGKTASTNARGALENRVLNQLEQTLDHDREEHTAPRTVAFVPMATITNVSQQLSGGSI